MRSVTTDGSPSFTLRPFQTQSPTQIRRRFTCAALPMRTRKAPSVQCANGQGAPRLRDIAQALKPQAFPITILTCERTTLQFTAHCSAGQNFVRQRDTPWPSFLPARGFRAVVIKLSNPNTIAGSLHPAAAIVQFKIACRVEYGAFVRTWRKASRHSVMSCRHIRSYIACQRS